MYDDRMKRAFHSIQSYCPPNFGVDLIDNENFITVRIPTHKLMALDHDNKIRAIEYVVRVKKAFEDFGGIVLITRTPEDKP